MTVETNCEYESVFKGQCHNLSWNFNDLILPNFFFKLTINAFHQSISNAVPNWTSVFEL